MRSTEPSAGPSQAVFWRWSVALVLFAWALQLYAIWSPAFLPLMDLPNHMARHSLEHAHLTGDELPPGYTVEYRILPNLGADLIVPLLLTAFAPAVACKVFLTLAVLLYWLGPALFLMQCCERRAAALAASLLLLPWSFTPQLFWGFLNFYSGFGFAFLALAHYLWLRRQDRPTVRSLAAHVLLVSLLFFWHLAPWLIYGLVMGCHLATTTVGRWREGRRLVPVLARTAVWVLPLLPSLALFAWYALNNRGVNPAAGYDWGGWPRKLLAPLRYLHAYDLTWDLAAAGLWAAAVACCFGLPLLRGWRWHWLQLGLAVLFVLYLVLPNQLGSTAEADSRLLPALLVCLVGCLAIVPPQRFRLVGALVAGCLVIRCGTVAVAWQNHSARLEGHAAGFAQLDPRSRVLPVILVPEFSPRYPEVHFVCWAVASRQAFVPTLLALPDQQPLRLEPRYRTLDRGHADAHDKDTYEITQEAVQGRYDYVWLYNPANKAVVMPDTLAPVFSRDGLTVWRVRAGEMTEEMSSIESSSE